jgi:hypothetical protein
MYGPFYSANSSLERIDNQIKDLENMRAQLQKTAQPAINQTFQLAPNHTGVRLVQDKSEVERELVFTDSAFFSNDMTTLWLKNTKGEIRTYMLTEVTQRDEKDDIIDDLKRQIDELKKGQDYAKSNDNNADKPSKE